MRKIKYIIFDLYDTLVYFDRKTHSYFHLFNELNLNKYEKVYAKNIALVNNFDSFDEYLKKLSFRNYEKINTSDYEDMIKQEVESVKFFNDVEETLFGLKDSGCKLGLISNLATPFKKPFFDLKMDFYFDEVIFSCDYNLKKPNPQIYMKSLECLDFKPEESLMIGNHMHYDVSVPISLGFNALHLNRNNVLSNYESIKTLPEIFRKL